MTLRERIARAVYESGQAYEGQSETYPPWDDIRQDEYLFYADAILRALAVGNPLWVECETCGGTGHRALSRDSRVDGGLRCTICVGRGFVPVGEE